jgi:hypothetical protein
MDDYGWGIAPSPPKPFDATVPYYRMSQAAVAVNDLVTVQDYATSLIAHEIGHTLALDDCNTCDTTTVMSNGRLPINNLLEAKKPSSCDNQQVAATDVQ